MSCVNNEILPVKSLSLLAQLVIFHRKDGRTSTAEIAAATHRSERQVWRARAELDSQSETTQIKVGDARPASRLGVGVGEAHADGVPEPGRAIPGTLSSMSSPPDTHDSDTGVTPPCHPCHPPLSSVSVVEQRSSRARIRNLSSIDTSYEEREEKKKERARESLNLITKNDSLRSISSVPESLPTPQSPPPVFRGKALVVSAEQHAEWRAMWSDYDLRLGYPIADADCVEKGKAGNAAVIYAQRKLGYLVSDWKQREPKRTPEEERLAQIDAALRARDPENYVNGMMS
jgi:hypothetical protein